MSGSASQLGMIVRPRLYLSIIGNIFGCHNWRDATGVYWVKARDAAKQCTRQLSTTNYSAPNINIPWQRNRGLEQGKI